MRRGTWTVMALPVCNQKLALSSYNWFDGDWVANGTLRFVVSFSRALSLRSFKTSPHARSHAIAGIALISCAESDRDLVRAGL